MKSQQIREMCEESAVIDLRSALNIFGIGEATGYRMARYCPDELPFKVLKVGRIYKVPSASILDVLGISMDPERQPAA
ncbi:hypothetical protein [Gordonia polyisoprenivorans]|uniref:hypothetical protein n=1 Tax=Gordonia polyisoprenivorans TaxID=84595 RepID=UPI00039E6985|nr:hypothetical protein [Gordonia polyisoprenivorans]